MPDPHVKDSAKLLEGRNLDLYNIIFETVTNNQEAVQETARKCKKLFKKKDNPADPNVLIQLEEILRERQDVQALAKHIDPSKQKNGPKTPDELKESLKKQREDYECYTENFLPALLGEITQSKKLEKEKAKEIGGIISGIISKSKDESRSSSTIQNQNGRKNSQIDRQDGANTPELSSGSDLDSGLETSKESLESPVSSSPISVTSTSSEESVNSTSSSAGEGNDSVLSKQIAEKKPQVQENENSDGQEGEISSQIKGGLKSNGEKPEQAAPEKPQVQESGNSGGQKGKISSQVKGELKSNGKESEPALLTEEEPKLEEKEEKAVLSKQEASNNQNNSEVKQPNNRNLHVALVAGCALSTIGCIVAGAMTSGLVGAGLLAMAAVFAIAAVAELHSNFLSSKLTSISVEPHVNDKELTACSHL